MALRAGGPAAQQTLIDALASSRDPMQQLRASVAEAPTRLGRKQAPYTFADALTQVTAREEAKRKALASRKDAKKSSKLRPGVTPPHDAFRGAVQGGGSEPSAFWMVMEDYFRDITREDLLELLPAYPDPAQDPAFMVPPLGRPQDAPAPEAGGFGSAPDSAAGYLQAQTPAARNSSGLFDPEELGSGRRSSRLTARSAKAAEDMRHAEQTAAEAATAAAAANAFAGPPGGCLLDACSAAELALIANQVLELRAAAPAGKATSEAPHSISQAAAAVSVNADGRVSFPELAEDERAPLQGWLAQQGAATLASAQQQSGGALGDAVQLTSSSGAHAPAGSLTGSEAFQHSGSTARLDPHIKVDWDDLMRPPPPRLPLEPAAKAQPPDASAAAAPAAAVPLSLIPEPTAAPASATPGSLPAAPAAAVLGSATALQSEPHPAQQPTPPSQPALAQEAVQQSSAAAQQLGHSQTPVADAVPVQPDAAEQTPGQPLADGSAAAAAHQPGASAPTEASMPASAPAMDAATAAALPTSAAMDAMQAPPAAEAAATSSQQPDPNAGQHAAAVQQLSAQQPAAPQPLPQQSAAQQPAKQHWPTLQLQSPAALKAAPDAEQAAAAAQAGEQHQEQQPGPALTGIDAAAAAPNAPPVLIAAAAGGDGPCSWGPPSAEASLPAATGTDQSAAVSQLDAAPPAAPSQQPLPQQAVAAQSPAMTAAAAYPAAATPVVAPPPAGTPAAETAAAAPAAAEAAAATPAAAPQRALPPPTPPLPQLQPRPAEGPVTWEEWCEALRRQPPLAPAPNQNTHLYTRMVLRQPARPLAPSRDAAAAAEKAVAAAAGQAAASEASRVPGLGSPRTPALTPAASVSKSSAPLTMDKQQQQQQQQRQQRAAGKAAGKAVDLPQGTKPLQIPQPMPNGRGSNGSGLQLIPEDGLVPSTSAVGASADAAIAKADSLAAAPVVMPSASAAVLPPADPRVPAGSGGATAAAAKQGQQLSANGNATLQTPSTHQQHQQQQLTVASQQQTPAPSQQQQQLPAATPAATQPPMTDAELAAAAGRAAGGARRGPAGSAGGKAGGGAGGGGGINSIAYNLLAGGKRQTGAPRRPASAAGGDLPAPHPVALENAAVIAAGKPEGTLEERWADLGEAADLVAAAPDDEILGEILALQAELAAVMVANRAAIVPLVPKALADLPAQQEASAHRDACAAFVRDYHMSQREVKRFFKREKREQQHREQVAAAEANAFQMPRSALGRQRGAFVDRPRSAPPAAPGAGKDPMIDALAERDEHEEALCAVCGGGFSEAPNEIVFCERCDVAVHQECYGVRSIPEGEWLCWPCKRYEEQQLAAGKTQAEVRKPRWETTADAGGSPSSTPRGKPPGGSRDAKCMVCPIRLGAFKQTTDGSQWVHVVCALWQQGLQIADEPKCEVVSGRVPSDAFSQLCCVCRKQEGATVKCGGKNCTQFVHPLCARNSGGYLTTRDVGGRIVHRAFCQVHAEAARRRDRTAQEQAQLAALGYPAEYLPAGAGAGASKRKAAPSGAAAERRSKAIQALVPREMELDSIKAARLELEQVRLMLERITRRERFKLRLAETHKQLIEAYLADPVTAARELGMDIGEDVAEAPPAKQPDKPPDKPPEKPARPLVVKLAIPSAAASAAAKAAGAAGGSAAAPASAAAAPVAAAPAGAAAGPVPGAQPEAAAQPGGPQLPSMPPPPPVATPPVGAKRKRDAAATAGARGGSTGKRSGSRRAGVPRELALLQHEAAAAGAPDVPSGPGAPAGVGPSLRASSLQGHQGADGIGAAGPPPLAAPPAAKQPRSRAGTAAAASGTPRGGSPSGSPSAAAGRRSSAARLRAGTPASVDGDGGTPRSTPGTPKGANPGTRRDRGEERSRGGGGGKTKAKAKGKAAATAPRAGGVTKAKAAPKRKR